MLWMSRSLFNVTAFAIVTPLLNRRRPPLIVIEGSVPVPPSVPPEFTVTPLEDAIEPFTISAPALTVVGPVKVLAPVRTVTPLPFCWNAPLPEIAPS